MPYIFNKLADWEFDKDRAWGVAPSWTGGSGANEGTIYGEDWAAAGQDMPGYTKPDKMLIVGMLSPDDPRGFAALNIYRQLVRSIIFNKQDPTSLQLQQRYSGLATSIRAKLSKLEKEYPKPYKWLTSSGRLGETLFGAELDNMLLSKTFDELSDHVNELKTPDDPGWAGYAKSLFIEDIKSNWTPEKLQKSKDAIKNLTNTYSFSRYAPGMALAAAVPFTLGALIGRPGLGLLLGTALSGGVGYYGYNRLNNTTKAIPWLDKVIGVDSQQMTPEANTVWNDYSYDGQYFDVYSPEEEQDIRNEFKKFYPDKPEPRFRRHTPPEPSSEK